MAITSNSPVFTTFHWILEFVTLDYPLVPPVSYNSDFEVALP